MPNSNTLKYNVVTGFYKCGNEHFGFQKAETISFWRRVLLHGLSYFILMLRFFMKL